MTTKNFRVSELAAVLAGLVMASTAAHAQWDAETPMTSTGGDVWGEGIAASGSTLHLVYGTNTISYRRSLDEGKTWSASKQIGTGALHLTDPIVADGNDIWIIHLDEIQSMNDWCCQRDLGSVWLLRSRDGGDTWDAPVELSASRTAFRLSIAYAANRLHLVWMDFRSGAWDTYYRRSPNRGDSWDAAKVIAASTGPFGAERSQIAARGDSVHVTIWDDRDDNPSCMPGTFLFPKCPDVFHMRSVDGGENWSSIVNVVNGGAYFAGRNDIAVAGSSNVVINYNVDVPGETGSKLFAIASSDDGATWADAIRLTFSANASDHGSIIGAGDAAYLVWHDDRDAANREIFYRRTPNGGVSWDAEERVSTGAAGDSSTPLNAITRGFAHVMWIDNRGGTYQVYYRRRALESSPTPDAGAPDAGAEIDAGQPDDGGTMPDAGKRPAADAGSTTAGSRAEGGSAAAGSTGSDRGGASGGAGAKPDAAPTTPAAEAGAGAGADAGSSPDSSSGCGCRIAGARPAIGSAALLLCPALVLATRRRRRLRSQSPVTVR